MHVIERCVTADENISCQVGFANMQYSPGDTIWLNTGPYNDPAGHPAGYECTVVSDHGDKVRFVCKDDGKTYREPKSRICNHEPTTQAVTT